MHAVKNKELANLNCQLSYICHLDTKCHGLTARLYTRISSISPDQNAPAAELLPQPMFKPPRELDRLFCVSSATSMSSTYSALLAPSHTKPIRCHWPSVMVVSGCKILALPLAAAIGFNHRAEAWLRQRQADCEDIRSANWSRQRLNPPHPEKKPVRRR